MRDCRVMNRTIYLLCSLFISAPVWAEEAASCPAVLKEEPLLKVEATASFFANVRGADGSIRAESKRMLEAAFAGIGSAAKPGDLCPASCSLPMTPLVMFQSIPKKYKSNYSGQEECEKLLADTSKAPFVYKEKMFNSVSELTSWFNDFSQGKGPEGTDLYNRCRGDCSPQYRILVDKRGAKYAVTANVICGDARDKDDNQYELSSAYLWQCA